MISGPETRRELRFACTRCGACCNRSPELLLSEAAALADVFVFRLMFRLYALPRRFAASPACGTPAAASAGAFYESKRLLAAFAAGSFAAKGRHGGKVAQYTKYLTISALTLETRSGSCAALGAKGCGIYERRPLACRAVPFHYSRPEASCEAELEAFAGTPGYGCDTSADAPVVVAAGRIVDPEARRARGEALALSDRERGWRQAILRRLRTGAGDGALPNLREIEANAAFGMTTISMRVAWQIAAESGLIDGELCRTLIAAQAGVIERELAAADCAPAARETLAEMRTEYRQLLNDKP